MQTKNEKLRHKKYVRRGFFRDGISDFYCNRMKTTLQNLLLVALSAVMMSFGWMELTGLVMLAGLVPMLILASRYDRSRRSFWKMAGWTALFIALWYAITIWWVWNSTPAGPPAAVFFAWIYTGVPFMLWFFISKRAPKTLSYIVLATVWTVGECVYNWNQASFPWLNIGNGFANDIWLVQWYEWTGVYGGTLWVLVTNILIYEFLIVRRPRRWLPPALAAIIPPLVSIVMFLTHSEPERTARITIIQPNIDSYHEKFTLTQEEQTDNLLELMSLAPPDVNFIVMPETAIDENLWEGSFAHSQSLRRIRALAAEKYPDAMVITGATTFRNYGGVKQTATARGDAETGYYDVYNSAIAIGADGKTDIHHKSKLLIGVEMLPDWWWVKYLGNLVIKMGGISGQLGYDTSRKIFNHNGVYAAAGICYESIYGEYFNEFVRNGAEVMFIITNDGWWGDTQGYRQHFNFARLRAVETRRAIARSANTGKSGFINTRGDVVQTLGWNVRGAITQDLPLNRKTTFYVRFGDYPAWFSLLALGGGLVWFAVYWFRNKKSRRGKRK